MSSLMVVGMAESLNLMVIGAGAGVAVCFVDIFCTLGSASGCLKILSGIEDGVSTLSWVLVATKDYCGTLGCMSVVTNIDSCTFGCKLVATRRNLGSWGAAGSDVAT